MTVATVAAPLTYTGPVSSPLPYTWRIFQDADLLVTQIDPTGVLSTLVLNTDYTVTGALSYTGGTVVLTSGSVAAGYSVTVARAPEAVQDTSLQAQGAYDPKVVENAFDLLTMIVQYLQDQLDRALVVPPGSTPLTLPVPEALALLQWNAGETGLQNLSLADLAALLVAGNFIVDYPAFTPGVSTSVTLSQTPGTVNNTLVTFDGAVQHKSTYTLAGLVLTFDAAIPLGVLEVEVAQAATQPLSIPADNSVATATIQNSAVTTTKIADDAVTTPKIADASVTLAKLAADALQGGRNGIVNGCGNVANDVDYVASVSGTYGYGKSELCKGALTGSTVAGTLTRVTNSSVGRTGLAFRWSAVTTTGAGIAKFRFFIEAKDALAYKNQIVSVSGLVRHDTGASVDFAIVVSKATVADNFTAVTVISTGPTIPVLSAINGQIYNRAISMGDCTNGIMVEITAAIGAVTGKLVDLTQVQLELGSVETDFEFEPYRVTQEKVVRYFEKLTDPYTHLSCGQCYDTSHAIFPIRYERKRTSPCVVTVINGANWLMTNGNGTTRSITGLGTPVNGGEVGCELTATAAAATLLAGDASLLLTNSAGEYITIDCRF